MGILNENDNQVYRIHIPIISPIPWNIPQSGASSLELADRYLEKLILALRMLKKVK